MTDLKIFAENLEQSALDQIDRLVDSKIYDESKIRMMPDAHAGAGCTIGTTMTITDKVSPNLVGVDIGCGVRIAKLSKSKLDLEKIDSVIANFIPSGMSVHNTPLYQFDISGLKCINHVDELRAMLSIGTLGGGNHFIEIDQDKFGRNYIVIHSGSRYLGKQVAKYYQDIAIKTNPDYLADREKIISSLKSAGTPELISDALKEFSKVNRKVPRDLAYLTGELFNDYIHDIEIIQRYASFNRLSMLNQIIEHSNIGIESTFESIHNYIDIERMILRKGAIDASEGKWVVIPLNMKDGTIIGRGKGNPDWNYSAPHGAGRIMSRTAAKNNITMDTFKAQMNGIYTTSVVESTLDEAPDAYKPAQQIIDALVPTVDIMEVIKPTYNFKAH